MFNIKPSKHLGQNFLIDRNIVKKVIKAANLKSTDIILEIGPGLGALTKELVKKVKQVIAYEKDPRMCQILKKSLKNYKNIEIVNGDVLKFEIIKLFKNLKLKIINYKVVSNLPFYITAPIIRKFLEAKNSPKEMVLLVQKEVAQRICARPPDMNLLAISVQFYAKPEIISYVSKKSFWPIPKVDSAIIKIVPQKKYNVNKDLFFKIVKAGFSQPRKQLANNLSKMLKLNKQEISSLLLKNNIKPTLRAEALTIKDWILLTKVLK
ncbi:MAG: ribosomal RNA small subunit methyltransferase A [Candidatus Nealsonbacteria bacterium CG08_land_8_20_14_0_20_36_22]|uniref:Ribosomal RNA small subunit methyltransferase A n=1 Tax=Candidatus Nealsonbacteria bacterium CG08_land_8_20_14_0_20_36_22 TaxID=1974704 RepID=A0A2H0YQG4_9BACT|nr:MAG: ribosomal RNA small subunit methyltransferase A [Candidatus Nealsonbacteria bacterium CG08_land_8_20_14_0_20_36_22]